MTDRYHVTSRYELPAGKQTRSIRPLKVVIVQPLLFEPYFRPQIWGERRLQRCLKKRLPPEGRYGESWEISAHPHHVSRILDGPLAGTLLTQLWNQAAAELWGAGRPPAEFPLLIKYLDCHDQLSIQVHPSDELAHRLLGEPRGKTEAWLVLQAEPSARIYAGLKAGVIRGDLERCLDAGTVADCLHSFSPRPGDCLFLPAGTVHGVGGGVLIAEVQQSSDATFRLFDWNRTGPDGKPRQLHRAEALQSIDWAAGPVRPVDGPPIDRLPSGVRAKRLVRCPHFTLERYVLGGELPCPHPENISIWMMLEGSARLTSGTFRKILHRGDTVLIPATSDPTIWTAPDNPHPPQLLRIAIE